VTLAELVERGLAEGHDTIVLSDDGQPIARAAFRAQVGAARMALWRSGDPRGRRIALHGTITPPLLAHLLACLVEGAVVVPIDAELPELRKAAMARLADVASVFDFAGGAAAFAPERAIVDPGDPARPHSIPSAPTLDDDDPCYVFFTSGTTGAPKGVIGRRRGLAHFVAWEAGMLGLRPGDRVSILTRPSFDVVLRDIVTPIVAGATACIAPPRLDPGALVAWLDDRAITAAHVVPSLARGVLAAAPPGSVGRALRHTLFAGEPLSGSLVRRWRQVFPRSEIYNLYGPTETTLAKFCAQIPPAAGDGVMPCGDPLPGAEAIIIDGEGAPVAAGELGEVAIATPDRSLGYLDPAQTRERFVRLAGRDVYLTGDLGFVAGDGQLHLRGRKDDQVKILGVRIELAGVAAAMQALDGIADAAVICVDDGDDKRLIGYFTARGVPGGAAIAQALRPYLAERLPPAAIPSRFIELPAMPLTPNGKLDRARLPRPTAERPSEPAASPVEQVISEAFAQALRRPAVGALDDFFALGGDSLAAAGVCTAIHRQLGAHLAPAELLTSATPRALAERVRAAAPALPIPRAPVGQVFALTPQQRRYVRTFCAGGNRSWCNMVAVFALPDGTTRAALEDALADIAARHDSLRLAFQIDDTGELRQSIDFRWDPRVAERDLSALDPTAARAAIDRLRIAEAERPIPPLAPGPLFRAHLLQLAGGERRLLWTVHHAISDGTSQDILARELVAVLTGPRVGEAERFAAPSFADVAAWAADRPGLAAARDYFRALFAVPYRHAYLAGRASCDDPERCRSLELAMPVSVRDVIRALARRHRTTPYAVLLAAVFRLLARRTGATDVAILTPLAGREHPQIAPLIGDFINLVPLRISNLAALPAPRLLAVVHQQVRDAARHQAFQLDELLDELGLPFDPDRNPLTGVSLNFMPKPGAMPPLPGAVTDKGYKLKYDILFLVRDYDDRTAVELQFRAGLVDDRAAAALLDELWIATEGLCHD
jgi:amino acid adenylation domain-containing protein